MNNNSSKDFLPLNEASKILNCHPNTLRLWSKKGIITVKRIGLRKELLFKKTDIFKLLSKRKLPSTSKENHLAVTASIETTYYSFLNILTADSQEGLYKLIVKEAKKLLDAEFGTIFLEHDGALKRVYASSSILSKTPLRPNGRTYSAFERKEPFISFVKNPEDIHPQQIRLGVRSIIFIPLAYKNKAIGVLNVLSKKDKHFSENDFSRLKIFGAFASLAIQNQLLRDDREQALMNRDLFISLAAHEMRTPLTAISAYAQLINRRINKQKLPDSKWSTILLKEINRLALLINELMQVEQIQKGNLNYLLRRCSLREVITRALADFKYTQPRYQISFFDEITQEDIVYADFDKILQAVLNLLNNAAKFSPENSRITIKLIARDENYIVSITDQGKGISPDDITHVFTKFYKGGKIKKDGMGLGLYLTKTIIDYHKGSIEITSTVNKGTTVSITLPKIHES